jgi:triphosphoribosyl-dephospho-CoA synthase
VEVTPPHDLLTPEISALAASAVQSLIDELEAYPKPGLVSPIDSGSHTDMDFALMSRSAASLLAPFTLIAALGREACPFETLIPYGLLAEKEMLRATCGINTHRGAIFSLGLLLVSLALVKSSSSQPPTPSKVRKVLLETWGPSLQAHSAATKLGPSHGTVVRRTTGAGGARHEAAQAFPSVFEIGLPTYKEALASGLDRNAASIQTLFTLMHAVEDTNILYRGGQEAAHFVRESAAQFLANGGCHHKVWFERAESLHRTFIEKNLSPGGSADLLSATLFLAANIT